MPCIHEYIVVYWEHRTLVTLSCIVIRWNIRLCLWISICIAINYSVLCKSQGNITVLYPEHSIHNLYCTCFFLPLDEASHRFHIKRYCCSLQPRELLSNSNLIFIFIRCTAHLITFLNKFIDTTVKLNWKQSRELCINILRKTCSKSLECCWFCEILGSYNQT